MLKLSTKGRYGLRAMTEIARAHGSGRPVMMSIITERQQISRKYLHAILTSLKKAGLVVAIRGARGGFILSRPPEEIIVREICEALEGKLSVVDCATNRGICPRSEQCETWGMWKRLNDAMLGVLSDTNLSDLVESPIAEGTRLNVINTDCKAHEG